MHINNFICPATVLATVRGNHVNPLHKCRTNIRKGKIKIMWKTKGSWRMLVVPKPLFIGRRQALHRYRGRKLWVIREYPCLTEDSMVKVYLFNQKPVMNGFFRKAIRFMFRLLGSATTTYLFALWIIEQAFWERGYAAYGGEFLLIPVVFYLMYKLFNRKLVMRKNADGSYCNSYSLYCFCRRYRLWWKQVQTMLHKL